ncbi:TPA: hypothetical protein ACTXXA_003115 [Legionella anisa]
MLKEDTSNLDAGKTIIKPIFDFKTNSRIGKETISPSEVITREGIFTQYFYKKYWSPDVSVLRVNVATSSYLDIIERRIDGDMQHRGRERKDCIHQERKYVGPGFLRYTASRSMGADVYITNEYKAGLTGQDQMLRQRRFLLN